MGRYGLDASGSGYGPVAGLFFLLSPSPPALGHLKFEGGGFAVFLL